MSPSIVYAPSILSADLARLADEVAEVEAASADWIHVDVMDGRFVPNLTLGVPVVRSLRQVTKLPLDVHLMIVEPEKYLAEFAAAGADTLSVHVEACVHLQRTLSFIRSLGKRAGVVLNPHTSEECLRYVLPDLDLVLVMSVNPGFGGQAFIPAALDKLARIRRMIDESGFAIDLEIDGGIDTRTAPLAVQAGARVLVAGSAIFGQPDRKQALSALRKAVEG
ncbi:MAG: ribulose-phosphate 3-epimerase [Polyangiaceae bacterium]|nr:ribulose-phosphate 3-epimerase [Polyangiaceae bacterium]